MRYSLQLFFLCRKRIILCELFLLLSWCSLFFFILFRVLEKFSDQPYRLLKRKAHRMRQETGEDRWKAPIEAKESSILGSIRQSIYRPLLLLTTEPMCLNLCIYSAILLGILYLFFGAFQLVFEEIYHFSLWQRGCSFLGILVGMVAMILTDPLWRRNYNRLERNSLNKDKNAGYQPEWRLPPGKRFLCENPQNSKLSPNDSKRSWERHWSQSASLFSHGPSIRMFTGSGLSLAVVYLEPGKHV